MAPSQNTFDTCSCARVRVKSAIFSTVDVLDQPFLNLWYCQPKDMQVIPDHEDQCCGGAPVLGLAAFRPAPGTSFFPARQTRCHALRVAMVPPRVGDGRMSSTSCTWLALRHRPTVRRDPTLASHAVHIRAVGLDSPILVGRPSRRVHLLPTQPHLSACRCVSSCLLSPDCLPGSG